MKTRIKFLTLRLRSVQAFSLFAVLSVSACALAVTASPAAEVTVTSQVTVTSAPEATLAPTETALAQPAATSRGPELEATDPSTVALASGGLQLVEFFRFT
jgi:hypothetical protein